MATRKPKQDALDALAAGDLKDVIALMLWKQRHENPDMAVLITEKDISGLKACTEYLNVEPDVRVFRRAAIPARAGEAAQGSKPAVPAFAGAPAASFVTVTMVAKGTEDTFKPIENNEEDAVKGERLAYLRRLRETIPTLSAQVRGQAAAGEFSQALVMELAEGAAALAQAK